MYALKYGAVPIARATGGLYQILTDHDPSTGTGNGFLFYEYTGEALWDTIGRVKRHFADPEAWQRLMRHGMGCDFSWPTAAQEYEKVYASLVGPVVVEKAEKAA
jgi:starch synthase